MALHPAFPASPCDILDPSIRWFPADESQRPYAERLMPPLVDKLRRLVKPWRESGYNGAAPTSISLLNWWFNTPHLLQTRNGADVEFQYYFAQREALETIIYLYDVEKVKDKYDLMRYDSTGLVSASMFDENWKRFVIKMATGSGKTKVLSLVLAWSYFHKLYELGSELARNFLVIAPNIIVLDRLYKDFQGLRIFFEDPVLPDNGYDGRDWHDDFQLTLHRQDEVRITRAVGNIFLTNIHRVYAGDDIPPSGDDEDLRDYFLGGKPVAATTDSKVDLGMIVREVDELVVLNDEAHHIHDQRLAWFKSIEDINNRLRHKGTSISLQVDVTATPKHNNGAIFVQTVADYPLVEAIAQNVVKRPVLPDAPSRVKLVERPSSKFTEKYADYIELGVIEWRKARDEHAKMGKKAVLFIMTDDTHNCDDVAAYLCNRYPDFGNKDSVLVIHTKDNGDISEASAGKSKEELEKLRKSANDIDDASSTYQAIISVMMLKEGWDVRNVTTIVGLRAYKAPSNILPEQTLGRGLRRMYREVSNEELSVVGTDAFMDFVESIQNEGVILDHKPMGAGTGAKAPIVVEVDNENTKKNLEKLDIEIPVMTPRVYREYKNLSELNMEPYATKRIPYLQFTEEQQREIVFKDIATGAVSHVTTLDNAGNIDYRSVVGYFSRTIMRELRLVSGYDVLYSKVKDFIQNLLFDFPVDLESPNTMRNLSELAASVTIIETFKKAINALTIQDKGDAEIRNTISLRQTRPFVTKDQPFLIPNKSVFNRIVGDSQLELEIAH
ncbi:MAG: DEAD/DEAH box helicase, partial [Anaerolineae bacterium]